MAKFLAVSGHRPHLKNCGGVVRPLVEPQHAIAGFFNAEVSRAVTGEWRGRQNKSPYFWLIQLFPEHCYFEKYRHSLTRSELNSVCLCILMEEA